jgi:predicted Zn-dependent protease
MQRLASLKLANPLLTRLQWQVWQANGQSALIRKNCSHALSQWPTAAALRYDCARVELQANQARTALTLLNNGGDFVAQDWRSEALRAEAFTRLGQRSASHAAQAESYIRQGKLEAAIDQLERAQNSNDGDFYTLSRVDARLRELKQRRELAKQKTANKR